MWRMWKGIWIKACTTVAHENSYKTETLWFQSCIPEWSWKETHVWHSEWKGFCKKSTVIDIIVEREVWGERECFPFEFFPLFTGCLLENNKEGQNQFIVGKWELFRIILFVTIIIWSDFLACQEIWIFNPFWSKPI